MDIKFNKSLKNYYYNLKHIFYDCNGLCDYILNTYLTNNYASINNEMITLYLKENPNTSKEEAFKELFYNLFELIDEDDEVIELNEYNKFSDFKQLNPNIILTDDYYKFCFDLNLDSTISNIKITKNFYDAYEGFLYDEVFLYNTYFENNKLGFFSKIVDYINLIEDNKVWMSITPYEINTMKKPINNASGNILVFGLGLAYFAFFTSNKSSVNSVTIIENNENIINLIQDILISKFPNKDKIKIIKDDIFNYLATNDIDKYDYLFVDTYHQPIDGIKHYLKILPRLNNKNIKYDFWIENSILIEIRNYLFTLLSFEFQKQLKNEYQFTDYQLFISNYLSSFLKNYKIENTEDIDNFLNLNNIKSMILKGE